MLNLANANTLMRLAISTSQSPTSPSGIAEIASPTPLTSIPASSTNIAKSAETSAPPLESPSLQFGPIWVREAQRTAAASSPISPTGQNVPLSSPIGTGALKEILCQPPIPEMHRDSLRHAFLSLSSSF